jgi:hypothetical protein
LNRGCTVCRFVHGVSGALQRFSHHGAEFALVFNQQERFHLSCFYHESRGLQETTGYTCAENESSATPQVVPLQFLIEERLPSQP